MQPTKFQLNFWEVVKTALEYKAISHQEARHHRKNFWVYNKKEHSNLYSEILEHTIAKMQLVHLKRALRGKQALHKMHAKFGRPRQLSGY